MTQFGFKVVGARNSRLGRDRGNELEVNRTACRKDGNNRSKNN